MTPESNLLDTARRAAERARDVTRDALSKLSTNVVAWRERSGGESEKAYVTELAAAEAVRRWRAAAALRRNPLGSPEAIDALVRALGDDEQFVRWHAAEALAGQEPGRAHPALERALNDADPLRRAAAAEALGKLGGEPAVLALRKCLADPAAQVREAVAAALGQIADPTTAENLLPLIEDTDPQVVRAAARALGQVGNTLAACLLAAALVQPGQDLLVRRALAAALARIPHPDAQPQLLQALRDPDPQVRAYAVTALGQVGNEDAHAPLQALTADKSRLIRGTVSDRARRAVELLERRGRREAQQT